jgi:hypothetical protein
MPGSQPNPSSGLPSLPDLMAQLLQRQARNCQSGFAPRVLEGEIVPFEAVPVQAVEPRLA